MPLKAFSILTIVLLFFATGCQEAPKSKAKTVKTETIQDTTPIETTEKVAVDSTATKPEVTPSQEIDDFKLTEENAIDFFFNYAKNLKPNKVRIKTKYGNIDVELYKNTPYHWANFIYLTRKHYFDSTYFHRVVPNFIIQGGNTDMYKTQKKRKNIGHYLLPPDTRKGHKHHRGTISMPSSEINNPHKLASPFEFFIVAQKPGAYHLDGDYTAFGHVIDGMDVVDTISQLATDAREWPHENVMMMVEILKD